ncbi:MAG TPA: hypothetical protein VI685_11510, partial [Candidatus Angelobacter sp.]
MASMPCPPLSLVAKTRANYRGHTVDFREAGVLTRMVLFTVTMLAQAGHTKSLYVVKPRFQDLLRPLAKVLAQAGVTANQVTLVACFLSVQIGLLALRSRRMLLLLPAFFLIRMALNAIDG